MEPARRRPVRLEVRRVDHQPLRRLPRKPALQRCVRSRRAGSSGRSGCRASCAGHRRAARLPLQAVPDHIDDPADHAPVVNAAGREGGKNASIRRSETGKHERVGHGHLRPAQNHTGSSRVKGPGPSHADTGRATQGGIGGVTFKLEATRGGDFTSADSRQSAMPQHTRPDGE